MDGVFLFTHRRVNVLIPSSLRRFAWPTPAPHDRSCCMTPWVVRAGFLTGRVRKALFLECCLQRNQIAINSDYLIPIPTGSINGWM
jgi:hypothetical protein